MALDIGDYALIGDCETAALVGKDGSIDWLCFPRFDSPACFAALLGAPEHGRWLIAPVERPRRVTRRYRADTLILETEFETEDGVVALVDFMPTQGRGLEVVRMARGVRGRVAMRMELVIRFDYGRLVPWVSRAQDGGLVAVAGPHLLVLRTPVAHRGEGLRTVADFALEAGEEVPFVLSYGPSHLEAPAPLVPEVALKATDEFWTEWAGLCSYKGPWRDAVVRSLLTLKALTYRPTGGLVAAPTTSLPEQPGGSRNWDYRFCWLRDATFTLLSLMGAGYYEEAEAWRRWLLRAVAGLPSQLQPLYGVAGEHRLPEWEVTWLPGYKGASPVRVGNGAVGQLQLDVFGEVLDALHCARKVGLGPSHESWAMQRALLGYLETIHHLPDRGIWEVRGPDQHFTHSKVMAWVAFDRAVTAVERYNVDGPVDHWRSLRDALHGEICERAFDPELGSFVQAYGSKQLDASALLIPLVGFLPPGDPRVVGTLNAITRRLMSDGFVRRYDTHETDDGLEPGEGAFLACTFWLADNFVLQGRHDEARALFGRLLALRNDLGLLAEEYDPRTGRQLGNFPQALSHLALVNTAFNLMRAMGPARQRAEYAAEPA